MRSKVVSLEGALSLVPDGGGLGVGGILMTRKPVALLDAIGRSGRRGLTLWTLLGSLDAELLAAHGALAASNTIYVGFEQLGPAPAYAAAVQAGTIEAREHSELTLIGGLRAALAGVPFLPTRGALGSDIARGLQLREVADPYTGEELLAAPAVRPDVTILHADAADERGAVLAPAERDFLFDFDANVARAADRVIASVERLAPPEEVAAREVLLFSHEVDAVVVLPGGARPSALPGVHGPDLGALEAYLAAARAGSAPDDLDRLTAR